MLLEILISMALLFGIALMSALILAVVAGVYLLGQDIGFWR